MIRSNVISSIFIGCGLLFSSVTYATSPCNTTGTAYYQAELSGVTYYCYQNKHGWNSNKTDVLLWNGCYEQGVIANDGDACLGSGANYSHA